MGTSGNTRKAFASVEAAVVVGVIGLACCVAMVGGQHARKQAGLAGSLANLKKIGEVTGTYAADFDEHFWTFSWTADYQPSEYDDLQQSGGDNLQATLHQAVDIVRRRFDEDALRVTNKVGHYDLSTLVLADYLDESLPMEWVVSPGDEVRLGWQADPHNPPDLNEGGGEAWSAIFAVFGSSYKLFPAFFAPDEATFDGGITIYQYPQNHKLTYVPGGLEFGGRRVSEVLMPGHKVQMAETASYFFGPRPVYYLMPQARVPVLMVDGSAAPRTSADANSSFRPNSPNSQGTSVTDYTPNPLYDPPTLSGGEFDDNVETHYKWTRRGLRGVDFSGERAE